MCYVASLHHNSPRRGIYWFLCPIPEDGWCVSTGAGSLCSYFGVTFFVLFFSSCSSQKLECKFPKLKNRLFTSYELCMLSIWSWSVPEKPTGWHLFCITILQFARASLLALRSWWWWEAIDSLKQDQVQWHFPYMLWIIGRFFFFLMSFGYRISQNLWHSVAEMTSCPLAPSTWSLFKYRTLKF